MNSAARVINRGIRLQSQQSRCALFSTQPSLDVEFPGVPALSPAASQPKPETKITTLPSGLRVASEETYLQTTSIGMFVDAGSRYENDSNNGLSHLMEHLAFKSTESRSHLRLVRDVEDIGGTVGAASARDYMVYTADVLRPNSEKAVEIISDTLLNPRYTAWDIEDQKRTVSFELEAMATNAQAMLTETLHAAAFGDDSPLGRPLWCPARNLDKLGADDFRAYQASYFTPDRMVLSGAGIDHEELVGLAEKYFGGLAPRAEDAAAPSSETSKYVGGDKRVKANSPLTHVALSFDAGGWKSDQVIPVCVLHMLLGGGGSFSAGGPGKGMYSRLYTNVLNRHSWVDSATAFNSMYNDGGLLGIYGTCLPSEAGQLVDVMAAELISVASSAPSAEETMRAKNQLRSSILMSLESRQVLYEDIGRQILTYGERESAASLCAKIDNITPEDLQKAAQTALKSAPTVAGFGDVSAVPNYDIIAKKFQ